MNCQRQDRKKHKTEDVSRYGVAHLGRLGWDESSSRIGPTMCSSLHLETRRDDMTTPHSLKGISHIQTLDLPN